MKNYCILKVLHYTILKAMLHQLEQYAKECLSRFKCLNSGDDTKTVLSTVSPDFIQGMGARTGMFLATTPNRIVSVHDAFIRNFSQRRKLNTTKVQFNANAFVYDDQYAELGRQDLTISFRTTTQLRDLNKKEIYGFVLDPDSDHILIMYHNHGLKSVIFPVQFQRVRAGSFIPY